MRNLVSRVALLVAAFGPGCSGTAPTSPTPSAGQLPLATPVVITAVSLATATVTATWSVVQNATRYEVELGTSPGATTVMHESTGTSDSFSGLAVGRYFVRVRAVNAVGKSNASAEASAVIIDRSTAEYVDGLLLGFGRFNPGRVADCPAETPQHAWTSFARGTTVRVRIGQNVPANAVDAIVRLANQAAEATVGNLATTVEVSEEAEPRAETSQLTIAQVPDPQAKGCSAGAGGCVVFRWGPARPTFGLVLAASVYVRTGSGLNTYTHEVGHGLYGLCHVDGNQIIGGSRNSLMSLFSPLASLTLTSLDLSALQAVYSTSLSPAATREDFVRVGLVTP
jgi:hypothetical protein